METVSPALWPVSSRSLRRVSPGPLFLSLKGNLLDQINTNHGHTFLRTQLALPAVTETDRAFVRMSLQQPRGKQLTLETHVVTFCPASPGATACPWRTQLGPTGHASTPLRPAEHPSLHPPKGLHLLLTLLFFSKKYKHIVQKANQCTVG